MGSCRRLFHTDDEDNGQVAQGGQGIHTTQWESQPKVGVRSQARDAHQQACWVDLSSIWQSWQEQRAEVSASQVRGLVKGKRKIPLSHGSAERKDLGKGH